MHNDERYSDINNFREYPPLTRKQAGVHARVILREFGKPADAAMRSASVYSPLERTYVSIARPASRDDLKRIWRARVGKPWGSVGRKCWASTEPTYAHDNGWGRLIHDVSHMIHHYRHPKERPHGHLHAGIEREVQVWVELHLLDNEIHTCRSTSDLLHAT